MHKTVKRLIEEEEQTIDHLKKSNFDRSEEITEKTDRIKALRRLWRKFGNDPLVQQMTKVVDQKVKHYHADFFYWDLKMLEKYEGRFAWWVGDCGTHVVWLDNETEEEEKSSKDYLEAIMKSHYGLKYTLYECDTITKSFKKTVKDNLQFKIVKPLSRCSK